MSQCLNCKAKLSCGCQKRVAVDGAQCCSTCVTQYNAGIATSHKLPIHTIAGNTAPTNVRIGYTPKK